MSKAEQLREAIDTKLMEQHYAVLDPKRSIVTADDVVRHIVSTLGITREMVDEVLDMAANGISFGDHERQGALVDGLDVALAALLDLAEGATND